MKATNLEIVQEWKALYEGGLLSSEIADKFNVDSCTVNRNLLKHFGIKRSVSEANKLFKTILLPEKLFSLPLTANDSYLLGLLATDGNVNKNGKGVEFCSSDIDLCLIVKNLIGMGAIYSYKHRAFLWSVSSTELNRRLIDLSITPNKSFTLEYPKCKLSHPDFFRGIIDGDGCIFLDKKYIGLKLYSASEKFINEVREMVIKKIGVTMNINKNKKDVYSIGNSGKKAIKIMDWMYANSNEQNRLSRKHLIYSTFK